mmetsp:Transcript_7572/g.22179  ORF Transcript_7572/g.22179 Transcript_7572/m.22179 type:complete len:279 (-) Transcript_7572:918-1754(-)
MTAVPVAVGQRRRSLGAGEDAAKHLKRHSARRACLRVEAVVDDAEARPEALGPLEVVEERPDEVAADIDALRDELRDRRQASGEVARASKLCPVAVCEPRLGDEERHVVAVPQRLEQPLERRGSQVPAHVALLEAGDEVGAHHEPERQLEEEVRRARRRVRLGRDAPGDERAVVVVDAEQVDAALEGAEVVAPAARARQGVEGEREVGEAAGDERVGDAVVVDDLRRAPPGQSVWRGEGGGRRVERGKAVSLEAARVGSKARSGRGRSRWRAATTSPS